MKTVKKFLSVILALMMVLAAMPLSALPVFAVTSGNFKYAVLSETDKTCKITDYTGWATELTIPSKLDGYTVTSIGNSAFESCTALTGITIPDSVTSVGERAFAYCTALTSIDVATDNPIYASENGVLFNKDKTTLLQYPAGKPETSYTIPDSVTSIGASAFYDCTSLTSVTIPDSVTSIGNYAFSHCSALTSVVILDGVTSIGEGAFSGCTALANITIPDCVTSIGEGAFYDCTALTNITIPDSVTSIGYGAFRGCTALTEIKVDTGNPNYTSESGVLFSRNKTALICYPAGKQGSSYIVPNSVMSIDDYAFEKCTALETITIPNSVTSIGNYAFSHCSALTSVVILDGVTSIGHYAFCDCTALTNITIPNSVTSINGGIFFGCTALTSVTIPDSVTSIGNFAFYKCTALTSIVIPDSVTSIGDWAFERCTALTSIVIPESVTSIGASAFSGTGIGTVYGYTGSYAETYAKSNGYTFVALNARGDVNGDGSPNSADYSMIKAYAIGNESLDLGQKYVSDLNCDGAVDAYDAIYLDLYLNGYLDTL